ncbi:MAG: trypsin-like peptidase domain-containing protein [Sphingomonadales bacterium]|nr:trypsin-like peptidase domain-containing protein [Sphingomonadales bacterium]
MVLLRHILPLLLVALCGCTVLPPRRLAVTGPGPVSRSASAPERPVQPEVIETAQGRRCQAVRLDDRTIATAAHCVADALRVDLLGDGAPVQARDILLHPAHDIAPLDRAAASDLAKLTLPAPVPTGARVRIAALAPGEVTILVRTGSSGTTAVACGFLGRSGPMAELSCPVALGWSGAPVVQNGALVGILSGRGRAGTLEIAQIAVATGLESF